ncbi:GDP-mannose 4,6-dehydratase [Candidatus Collierbacteria bacterium]|nr:GDP-mannose 4,6-dehydratase [Candidatus Collierbacteria bacterium]
MSKKAFITGITGQDGSYLAEFLLDRGYEVHGLIRRTSTVSTERVSHLLHHISVVDGDLTDQHSLTQAIQDIKPDEVYNLAAQSFIPTSFRQPVLTGEASALGVTRILEAVRIAKLDTKFYQASSSEMFGKAVEVPQSETTPFSPRSPYGVAKVYGHWITVNYREAYNLFAVSGILFNHESPRRGLTFITRKITMSVACLATGLKWVPQNEIGEPLVTADGKIAVGNLESKRDWGFAGDYVEAMWMMLQQKQPDDFVIGTGETHSVKEFIQTAFESAGLKNWEYHVTVDKRFYRPAEVDLLIADPAKANRKLGWKPKTSFKELVNMMVEHDIKFVKRQIEGNQK